MVKFIDPWSTYHEYLYRLPIKVYITCKPIKKSDTLLSETRTFVGATIKLTTDKPNYDISVPFHKINLIKTFFSEQREIKHLRKRFDLSFVISIGTNNTK